MSEIKRTTAFTLNGARVEREVPVRMHLIDLLREDLGLTGSHLGCEQIGRAHV